MVTTDSVGRASSTPYTSESPLTRVLVRALKYDGSEHRHWPAGLAKHLGSLIVLDAEFESEVIHDSLGTIPAGTHSLEYYWLDKWYNVFRFAEPDGSLRNYYCNINVPPTFDGHTLTYVDLDLDILVAQDLSYQVLDVDDFERNAEIYDYPRELRIKAREAVDELIVMIRTRAFPFSD